ncbi:hypothetical protein R3Q08_07465 [Rhodococcus erythropolis]|uniref:hypothetical protein n=1 Tax=Rhodococcus erythropolis TaxID=1833 RepID=UPI0002EFB4BC|nr:hypothetical protein [Rhodococcus erythropolis]EQM31817.1 hypothetical protein N601_20190 [Rhodococcus erythropolis DN1]MDV6208069.1 hypothetical protein [Rhodococcus erythropolis]
MSTDHVRITPAVQQILTVLVTDPHNEIYGYRIMDALGFSPGKTHRLLARLVNANWLIRNDPGVDRVAGQPRVTYSVARGAQNTIAEALAEARERESHGSRFRARGLVCHPRSNSVEGIEVQVFSAAALVAS